ncbi:ATP-dependent zinc metalloprotease FtsH [Clostridiaceae bacterium M8S5]|nr:ATP-dependent zinc metalloprotease FtsH [Clostridiaceae bacterium M8S5]
MRKFFRGISFYLLIFIIIIAIVHIMTKPVQKSEQIAYSKLEKEIEANHVKSIKIVGHQITGEYANNYKKDQTFITQVPDVNKAYIDKFLLANPNLVIEAEEVEGTSLIMQILPTIFMILIFVVFWFVFMQQSQGGGSRVMSFGKSRAKMHKQDTDKKVTFKDVAGLEEEKEELKEIVDFLSDPKKYIALGARIPKGVLMVGPPGTGKTYLSRAVAGEAGVPFFSISGSDFVEMFVGVGASRVRDLFEQAKKNSPCIIFIDEIDAVGRRRGAGLGGGHDEREQTLNQLLVEMDGFGNNEGIIMIAATNRPDILDPALLRPGRFDRQVHVGVPDIVGREAILRIHSRGKPLEDDVDLKILARRTPGFTPADLENLMNEAALLTARKDLKKISMDITEEAITKVIAGPEKKSRVISEKERKLTAFHEAGHALVARLLPNTDPVHMITIIPRGRAGGFTMILPKEDRYYTSKTEMEETLVHLLGGRVAEKLVLDDISTGASNDIERATKIARNMVTHYGMSTKLGPMTYGTDENEVFIGRDFGRSKNYSEQVAAEIDNEMRRIIDVAYTKAKNLISDNMNKLHDVANALLEKETLSAEEFENIFTGKKDAKLKEVFESGEDEIKIEIKKDEEIDIDNKKDKE